MARAQEARTISQQPHHPNSEADEVPRDLIAGVARALAEHGYASLTVEHVLVEAGVSRDTFHRHFADKEEAVLAAHEAIFERFLALIAGRCETQCSWAERVAATIAAAIDFAIEEPEQAQLLTIEAVATSPSVAKRVLRSLDRLATLLGEGRSQRPRAAQLPALTEKAQIGAISGFVAECLMSGEPERLPELRPQLVELTLLPYVGGAEAARLAEGQR